MTYPDDNDPEDYMPWVSAAVVKVLKLEVSVAIPPGDLAINQAWRKTPDGMVKSAVYKDSRDLLRDEFRLVYDGDTYAGWVDVEIVEYWPDDKGDVDAPIKGVLDALQAARVIEDDKRVRRVAATKFWDPDNPRLEVKVRSVR